MLTPPMIAPYLELDGVTLYHGDALELLPALPPMSVHCCVTDPPYVIGAVSAGNIGSKSGGWPDLMNSSLWFTTWYREIRRVIKPGGSFWTFLNWRTQPVVMRAAMAAGMPITSLLVWDKEWIGPGGSQGLRPSYELVALLAQPEFAIPDRGIPDIWRHPWSSRKPNGHPAEKPEGLVRRILQTAELDAGQIVLDPFVGSGTTALAARSLGLRCVAFEDDEAWCEVTARRLAAGELDLAVS